MMANKNKILKKKKVINHLLQGKKNENFWLYYIYVL